jgi:hypothetical protein
VRIIASLIAWNSYRFDMDVRERVASLWVDVADGRVRSAQVDTEAVVRPLRRFFVRRWGCGGGGVVIHNAFGLPALFEVLSGHEQVFEEAIRRMDFALAMRADRLDSPWGDRRFQESLAEPSVDRV